MDFEADGRLSQAYSLVMRRMASLNLTLLKSELFQNRHSKLTMDSRTLITVLQGELKASRILLDPLKPPTASNGTHRQIATHVVRRMLDYHLGDIEDEAHFPALD